MPQPTFHVSSFKSLVSVTNLEAYYGLPNKVEFCRQCVISNQRPNSSIEQKHTKSTKKHVISFTDGICDACLTKDWKDSVNWLERDQQLRELCARYRSSDGSYDCIVPGSGGKDSFMQAHLLKYKYGMHPLTVTWAPHIYTPWGWRNFQKWIHAGFDNLLVTPNGRQHRLLTRLSTENLLHPFQPFIIGQRHLAAKVAARYGVSLIFYGESGSEYGNPSSENSNSQRLFEEYEYFNSSSDEDVFLGGTSFAELKADFGFNSADFSPYLPVDPKLVEKHNIQVHYLGYYVKWHPQAAYYYAVEHGGFEAAPERTPGTYSKYNSIDDMVDDIHYFTTYIKFGIGRATYDASQEVRSGDIDRDEAIALIKRYDGEYPQRFEKEIFKYLSIDDFSYPESIARKFKQPIVDREYFFQLCDQFRSPHLWKFVDGSWRLRHTVFDQ